MESLFLLYYSALEYIYLGLLNGSIKYDDIKIPKADIDYILSLKLEEGDTLDTSSDEIREMNIFCMKRLMNKLYEDRLSKWTVITKRTSFRKQKFNFENSQKILRTLLDFCDPTIAIEVTTCNNAVIKVIKNLSSWLEKYIFLRYLSNQVSTSDCFIHLQAVVFDQIII